MVKRKIIIYGICISVLFTGCSGIHGINSAEEDPVETERTVLDNEKNVLDMKGMLCDYDPVYDKDGNIIDKKLNQEFKINDAVIYNTPNDAKIERDKLTEADCYLELSPEKVKFLDLNTVEKSKIMMVDFTVKSVSDNMYNITCLELAYKKEDNEMICLGSPVYFSDAKTLREYYHYVLPKGESKNMKVAWIVDEKTLKIKNFDKERIYIGVNTEAKDVCQFLKPDIQEGTK